MALYRIAEVLLHSQIDLPSFTCFACDPCELAVQVNLERSDEIPGEGEEITSSSIVSRRIPEGWFYHSTSSPSSGLIVSKDYRHLRLVGEDIALQTASAQEELYVRIALECLMVHLGYVSLHASAINIDGKGIAFTGPSGTGKSTRARAWMEAFSADFISGDRPLVRSDGKVLSGVPWDGKEKCFRNISLPLGGIFEIRRSATSYVRKLDRSQARQMLLRQSFLPMWDTDTAVLQMININRLASSAEFFRMFSGPSPEDAKKIKEIIENEDYLKEEPDMKAKSGFVLRNIAGEYMLMPVGDNISNYKGAVLLNKVSAFIWEKLQDPVSRDDLLTAVLDEFDVDESTAANDLDDILKKFDELGLTEN